MIKDKLVLKPLLLALCLFQSANALSQTDGKALPQANSANKIEQLETLAKQFENSDTKKASAYARQALIVARGIKDSSSTMRMLIMLGQLKRFETLYDSSRIFYEEALLLSKRLNQPAQEAESLNGLSVVNRQEGDLAKAVTISLEALRRAEVANDLKQIGIAYFSIGYVFNMLTNFDSALFYHRKALTIHKTRGDSLSVAGSYNGIGLVYMKREKYDEARKWYLRAASLVNEQDNARQQSMIYNNIGVTYENQGQFAEGRTYYFKSLKLKEQMNDKRGMASTYGNLGDNYLECREFDKAIEYLLISQRLSKETKSLDYLITAEKLLSYSYELKGNYEEALRYYSSFVVLKDSLYDENKTKQINELMNKYTLEKKEKENVSLKASAALTASDLARHKIIIAATAICLLIVVSLLIFLTRLYKKSQALAGELAIQKEEAVANNEKLQEVLRENANMTDIMVHDLRSPMNQVMGLAELIQLEGSLNENHNSYISMMKNAVSHGRRVVDDLMTISKREALKLEPAIIYDFLKDFIGQYTTEAEKKDIKLLLLCSDEGVSIKTDREVLRRILDNLVSNAIKFSPLGKSVTVTLSKNSQFTSISVGDEGPGFSDADKKLMYQKFARLSARPTAGESSTGLGLAIVKHLADQLNGTISLTSEVDKGAEFKLSLPN